MNNFNSRDNIFYYENLLKEFGYNSKSLGWNRDNQILRFDALLKNIINSISNCNINSILDVGCGYADLFFYLKNNNISFKNYIGLEVVNNFFLESKNRLIDNSNASILNIDFLNFNSTCDLVLGSGIFGVGNGSHKNMLNYVDLIIRKSISISKYAFSYNFLSSNSNIRNSELNFYVDVNEISSIVKTYTSRFIIDHSYSPYEFTLTVFCNNDLDELLWYK
jgi:SAM-dependent methyltransferase